MERNRKIAFGIALIVVVGAIFFRFFNTGSGPTDYGGRFKPELGALASTHEHMTMLVFIDGRLFDFTPGEFQLQGDYVHFEDGDGVVVHKHATGVTLSMLFESLGMNLTSDCLSMKTGLKYCTEGDMVLKTYLNREPFGDWQYYELRPNDKILIDYGNGTSMDIALRLNAVPDLPEDL